MEENNTQKHNHTPEFRQFYVHSRPSCFSNYSAIKLVSDAST